MLPVGDFVVNETNVTLTAGQVKPLLGADPSRWAVIFGFGTQGNTAQVSTKSTVTTSTGLFVSGTVPLELDFRTHGALVCQPWFAIGTGATITVIEILYRPSTG